MAALDISLTSIYSLPVWVSVAVLGTTVAVVAFFQSLRYVMELVREMVWIPWRVTKQMRKQGYSGPSLSFFRDNRKEVQELTTNALSNAKPLLTSSGMSHDFMPAVFIALEAWRNRYGDKFIFKHGSRVTMHASDAETIKEIFLNNFDYGKSPSSASSFELLGSKSIIFMEGEEWTIKRKVVRPAFYPGRTKRMVEQMVAWLDEWLEKLDNQVAANGGSYEIDMFPEIADLLRDILARSSFGTSFSKGKEGFAHQDKLRMLITQRGVISNPLARWFPSALQKEINKESKEVSRCLREIIQERRKSLKSGNIESYGDDLLGLLLADRDRHLAQDGMAPGELETEDEQIMDQCRTFFFTGAETMHKTLAWAIVLLGYYNDWQEKIRTELQQVLRGSSLDGDQLSKLKQINMFLEETLRLYGPVPIVHRQVSRSNIKLQGEPLPKDLVIFVNLFAIHRDKEYWGDDVLDFKPERFANGLVGACKKPHAFEPFGWGPRICVAQAWAMTEMKVILVQLLQRFSFRLSPSYRHQPEPGMGWSLQPKSGAQVVLQQIHSASA